MTENNLFFVVALDCTKTFILFIYFHLTILESDILTIAKLKSFNDNLHSLYFLYYLYEEHSCELNVNNM